MEAILENGETVHSGYAGAREEYLEERKRGRILVVDDERCIRETLLAILHAMGFEAAAARDGDEGLDMFVKSHYDLVFMDLQMPGMDGWSLALHIKNQSPDTPIILITGEQEDVVMGKLDQSAVDLALFKPFQLHEIQEAIQSLSAFDL